MRDASANKPGKGARLAAGARRLLAARLLAFLVILFLAVPVSEVSAGHSAMHGPAVHHSIEAASPEAPSSPDEGVAHHCAQCACHQMLAVQLRSSPDTNQVSVIHFPRLARATSERATTPPHKPPRA